MDNFPLSPSRQETVENWRRELKYDPFPPLLSSGKKELNCYARRDLLGKPAGSPRVLWNLPEAREKKLWVSLAICRVLKRFLG